MSSPLAVLGGTFDPIHYGHLELAREVRETLALPEVLLIPAGDPPHRDTPRASAADRVAMLRLALGEYPGLALDDREIRRSGRSYTVLTLEELRAERPLQSLAFIVGADAFLGLPGWYRWREIFRLAHLIVIARPGLDLASALNGALLEAWRKRATSDSHALENPAGGAIYTLPVTPHDVSASAIRAAISRGNLEAVRGLLPDATLAYIQRKHLYQPLPGCHTTLSRTSP